MKHKVETVTNGGWNVGSMSGDGIKGCLFHPFRLLKNDDWRTKLEPECHGKLFASHDAASDYALSYGFTKVFYSRPSLFIHLRLSPATRKHLQTLTKVGDRWYVLERLAREQGWPSLTYIHFVRQNLEQRAEWERYMMTGECDTLNPQKRKPCKALTDWRPS